MNDWLKPRTIFALMFYFTYLVMISHGLEVPETLRTLVDMLMGFYFGQKLAKVQKGVNQ